MTVAKAFGLATNLVHQYFPCAVSKGAPSVEHFATANALENVRSEAKNAQNRLTALNENQTKAAAVTSGALAVARKDRQDDIYVRGERATESENTANTIFVNRASRTQPSRDERDTAITRLHNFLNDLHGIITAHEDKRVRAVDMLPKMESFDERARATTIPFYGVEISGLCETLSALAGEVERKALEP